ncbi:hypothetical protein M8A51_16620 [Schlegelella sp. S2-27]|uniref:Uncharacterized protein n=1 Tax=Caldimonas mangrovi TaxID=2944811 RepID=A0ABT0YS91_9BURK|nr:hypothetical protein [Caldimonas mangrovi]MCM5681152.1 hypothetical protein [Caldimonas mangrovi]
MKRLLWALLVFDFAFMGAHLVHTHGTWLSSVNFSIKRDGGYAERFQYLQLLALGTMLLWLFAHMRRLVLLLWAGLFLYLACDDALRLHERAGLHIAETLEYADALSLRARDWGELTVALAMSLVAGPLLIGAWHRATGPARLIARDLALLAAALLTCAIGVDMLQVVWTGSWLGTPLALLEDGGEMVVASTAVYYVLQWAVSPRATAVAFRPPQVPAWRG